MADRITAGMLEQLCRVVNSHTDLGPNPLLWTRDDAGNNVATVGAFYIDGAYGGVSLVQIMNEDGGVRDVLGSGHVTKRELYDRIQAYLRGVDDARRMRLGDA